MNVTLSHSRRLPFKWGAAIASVLLCIAVPSRAAEEAKFPADTALKDSFKDYIAASENGLKFLDSLAEGSKPIGTNWKTECDTVQRILITDRAEALNLYHKRGGKGPLPASVEAWYKNEATAWANVIKIGNEMVTYHNQVLAQKEKIEKVVLPAFEYKLNWIKVAATGASRLVQQVEEFPDMGDMANDKAEGYLKDALTDCTKLVTGMNKIDEEVAAEKRQLDSSPYRTQLVALKQKDIDPDQVGVFATHEKRWEAALSATLAAYDKIYQDYVKKVTIFKTRDNLLKPYTYLRAIPATVSAIRAWLGTKVNPALNAPPEAKIGTRVLVADMRAGRTYAFRVRTENIGKRPFAKDELELVCSVVQPPKGYNISQGSLAYTEKNTDSIAAGGNYTFSMRQEIPPGVGEWQIKFQLKFRDKVLDTQTDRVTTIGSIEAEIDRIDFQRTTDIDRACDFEVTVENTGQTPLDKNNLSVVCSVSKGPKDYRVQSKDFYIEGKPTKVIAPGAKEEIKLGFKRPPALGDWELEFQLELEGRVTERKKIYFKVIP